MKKNYFRFTRFKYGLYAKPLNRIFGNSLANDINRNVSNAIKTNGLPQRMNIEVSDTTYSYSIDKDEFGRYVVKPAFAKI